MTLTLTFKDGRIQVIENVESFSFITTNKLHAIDYFLVGVYGLQSVGEVWSFSGQAKKSMAGELPEGDN